MDNNKSISEFLTEHAAGKPASFHMPGHKGAQLYRDYGYGEFLDSIVDCDITEIPGADNLFQPEGIIRRTMDRYSKLYASRESYLLINGSSAGLIAAVMASVQPGGRLIMARNCHKSVFSALELGRVQPAYVYPEILDGYDIAGPVTAEQVQTCISAHPDAQAVILPSPNYYGICSDIRAIAETVHNYGKILIVDQAHGAHLKFFDQYIGDRPLAAEDLGADIVINSTHKTLASFTQSAVLNLCSDRVDKYRLEDELQLIESTSPSYLLMGSLDINAELLESHGRELVEGWQQNLRYFYESAVHIRGLSVIEHPMLDRTKINLDMSALGIDGPELENRLMDRGIIPELVTGNILMCMTGIGNKRCDFDRLLQALREISSEGRPTAAGGKTSAQQITMNKPEQKELPSEKERVPLEEGEGRVCAASIVPYPPGIPIVCPGEVIDGQVLNYVSRLRRKGEKVIGIDDRGRITVGK